MDDLAFLAAVVVLNAASTDAWEMAKHGFARLLGRGDPKRERLAEEQLDRAHAELLPSQGRESTRAKLGMIWRTLLANLLEQHPDAAGDMRALVQRIQEANTDAGRLTTPPHLPGPASVDGLPSVYAPSPDWDDEDDGDQEGAGSPGPADPDLDL